MSGRSKSFLHSFNIQHFLCPLSLLSITRNISPVTLREIRKLINSFIRNQLGLEVERGMRWTWQARITLYITVFKGDSLVPHGLSHASQIYLYGAATGKKRLIIIRNDTVKIIPPTQRHLQSGSDLCGASAVSLLSPASALFCVRVIASVYIYIQNHDKLCKITDYYQQYFFLHGIYTILNR